MVVLVVDRQPCILAITEYYDLSVTEIDFFFHLVLFLNMN